MTQAVHWQKSTFSDGGDGNTCVELTATEGRIRLRESDDPTTQLATEPTPLRQLLRTIKKRQI
jgi:hypothetical protein